MMESIFFLSDVNMMEEAQLNDTSHLDDGSEYSPVGIYIYINSTRTGTIRSGGWLQMETVQPGPRLM